jgi:hypothetical protein
MSAYHRYFHYLCEVPNHEKVFSFEQLHSNKQYLIYTPEEDSRRRKGPECLFGPPQHIKMKMISGPAETKQHFSQSSSPIHVPQKQDWLRYHLGGS